MRAAFVRLQKALRPGGAFVLIAGRNRIKQVSVDTFGLLISILESLGMDMVLQFDYEIIKNALKLTRHRNGGHHYIRRRRRTAQALRCQNS